MKTFIVALLVLFCSASYAQITLEHKSADSNGYFTLIQTDTGEYHYLMYYYGTDTNHGLDIKLFDLDHNLVKEITSPIPLQPNDVVLYITRRLFHPDDNFEFLLYTVPDFNVQTHSIRILQETGAVLFSCDSCSLGYNAGDGIYTWERGIYNTPKGAKMLVSKHYYRGTPLLPENRVYSLPGILPGGNNSSNHTSSAPEITYIESALDIEMAPNPASENIRVSYRLPAGDLSGYITIRDTKGAELQRHEVHFADGSLSLDVRPLACGTYYCCLLTGDGRTTVKKMMVVR